MYQSMRDYYLTPIPNPFPQAGQGNQVAEAAYRREMADAEARRLLEEQERRRRAQEQQNQQSSGMSPQQAYDQYKKYSSPEGTATVAGGAAGAAAGAEAAGLLGGGAANTGVVSILDVGAGGGLTYGGGATYGGAAGAAGASGGAAGGGAAGGSGAASAGWGGVINPWTALAAVIAANEFGSRKHNYNWTDENGVEHQEPYRSHDKGDALKQALTGKSLILDVDRKWNPKLDSLTNGFWGDSGLGGDSSFGAKLANFRIKDAFKDFGDTSIGKVFSKIGDLF